MRGPWASKPGAPIKARGLLARPRAMADLLFAHGMDPNRPTWVRRTPLHHFAGEGDVEAAGLYLDHGADIDAREEDDCSRPLALAARNGRRRMVEFLLRRGSKPRVPDDPEWATPIAWATRKGHDGIVRLLTEFERTGQVPRRSLRDYEALVSDLVAAFKGDGGAMQRVIEFFQAQRPMLWDRPSLAQQVSRLRGFVQQRLGRGGDPPEALSEEDAKALVARSEGYENWESMPD
jgi:hypothetical protein